MPRVAVLGASGGLGGRLVARALELGWRVNALVRDPSKLRRQAEDLTVFKFDAETGEGLEAGLEHCQQVICAVGGMKPVVTSCVTHVVRELGKRKKPVQRLVLVSRVGASESRPQSARVSGPIQVMLPALLGGVYRDLTQAEAVLRVSKLPYSIFRATRLTDEPGGAKMVVAVPSTGAPPHRVSRTDLASFIVDSLERPEWAGREVTVGAETR